jgi:hypothetical protein
MRSLGWKKPTPAWRMCRGHPLYPRSPLQTRRHINSMCWGGRKVCPVEFRDYVAAYGLGVGRKIHARPWRTSI